jgi:hypothetical protein
MEFGILRFVRAEIRLLILDNLVHLKDLTQNSSASVKNGFDFGKKNSSKELFRKSLICLTPKFHFGEFCPVDYTIGLKYQNGAFEMIEGFSVCRVCHDFLIFLNAQNQNFFRVYPVQGIFCE